MANRDYISDELLAAYLDGNTTEEETQQILQAIREDEPLCELLDIASDINEDNVQPDNDVLPMMKMAAESGRNTCSVLGEAFVLQRRGIGFEEKELFALAEQNDWLRPKGTPLHAVGQLLVHYGLMITHKYDATIDDIKSALLCDNDVLVVVDSDKLYPGQEDLEDAPNHAIVVTSVDDDTVAFFDPKEGSRFKVQGSRFKRAWAESHNYMVRVLQSIEDYDPQPINLDAVALTDNLIELQEAIAENAHDVWAAARIKEGWTYGPVRDDVNKKHPDLIPYSALPDSEKEYDRIMALNTIKLVKKLGFDIVKK